MEKSVEAHIIAEAGSNHNGDFERALQLVDIAASAQADSIKFQLINPEGLYVPRYVGKGSSRENPVFAQRKKEALPLEQWQEVYQRAQAKGVPFTLSIFDGEGLDFVDKLGLSYVKIASTDLNNYPLLAEVARRGLRCIVSTGMSSLAEVEKAVATFATHGSLELLSLLHCVSVYPCPLHLTTLERIPILRAAFGVPVGFSDHTEGSIAAAMAVALGATTIEKHFTYDRSAIGFDHAHALSPDELREFTCSLREAAAALSGDPQRLSPEESVTKIRARRGIYASRNLEPGHILTREDLLVVRPSTSLSPDDVDLVVGMKVKEGIIQYAPLGVYGELVSEDSSRSHQAEAFWAKEMAEKGMT